MSHAPSSPTSQSNALSTGTKTLAALLVAAFALAAFHAPASARACKRVCMGGSCWYDCSKVPGQP
jgi:hypothetical protein